MNKKKINTYTPLMKQYYSIKKKYSDALLLFRVGDFYESFGEDAVKCSKYLNIILTKRNYGSSKEVKLSGFPYNSLNSFIPKLIKKGIKVAICDQLETYAKKGKIIKRGVTEIITPGVSFNDSVLKYNKNNFLSSIYFFNDEVGLSFLDVSTGNFFTIQSSIYTSQQIINKINPKEIIYKKSQKNIFKKYFEKKYFNYEMEDWVFDYDDSYKRILEYFNINSLTVFGIENDNLSIISSSVILYYVLDTCKKKLKNIYYIKKIEEKEYLIIDNFSFNNLEIIKPIHKNGSSLMDILDKTNTPMGARLIRYWINFPLKKIKIIKNRQKIIKEFIKKKQILSIILSKLKNIYDIDRLVSKIVIEKISLKEIIKLFKSLNYISEIKNILFKSNSKIFIKIEEKIKNTEKIYNKIYKILNFNYSDEKNIILSNFSEKLDKYRFKLNYIKKKIKLFIEKEKKITGINIKLSFNNIFGYYIEIKKKNKKKIPKNWIKKQTLSNVERYTNEKLKNFEEKILTFKEKIFFLEKKIYKSIIIFLQKKIEIFQFNSKLIAKLDVLCSFSKCAIENNYVKPIIDNSFKIDIKLGRHPVIEKNNPIEEKYIPNDIYLDNNSQQIIIVTGPNMSGKSAILRQTALIVIMAQIGSYIPAYYAKIGIIDKIFSRIGASDNISLGKSTFMVEMNETSYILNNFSERSLIILDEIGRGTSTYDGISISWAIIEYLHKSIKKPKTLLSTHYTELTKISNYFSRVKNYTLMVKKIKNEIIFMRKFIPGINKNSFGIYVAKISGIPNYIIKRSEKILLFLKKKGNKLT